MPWRDTCPMGERQRFIDEWMSQEWTMIELCRHYGISRPTGYKWLERFEAGGRPALADRTRARHTQAHETPEALVELILAERLKHPFWGPNKLLYRLMRQHPIKRWPAASTIGDILKRNGLTHPRRRRRRTPMYAGPFCEGLKPNAVWMADFKGWFRTRDGQRIDPFTVSDCASRFLLKCQAVKRTDAETVQGQLTSLFKEYGLPDAMRSDNGVPFATVGLGGLSRLSVWLIRLGILPERIRPGHPEENGRHERMHRTLKQATAKPPQANARVQQEAFDRFRDEFNEVRPHEALGMRTPAEVYTPSVRPFPIRLPEIEYPGAAVRRVAENGTIKWNRNFIYVSNALIGQTLGVTEKEDGIFQVQFGPLRLGSFRPKQGEIVSVRPEKSVNHVPGLKC